MKWGNFAENAQVTMLKYVDYFAIYVWCLCVLGMGWGPQKLFYRVIAANSMILSF